jgi:hypothetical protein
MGNNGDMGGTGDSSDISETICDRCDSMSMVCLLVP